MYSKSIINIEKLALSDETENSLYGCNQDWYSKVWQRKAGCGPTTASNLTIYLFANEIGFNNTLASAKALMENLWNYVTPGCKGVNSTEMFYLPYKKYLEQNNLPANYEVLDITPEVDFSDKLLPFLKSGLEKDVPIAFLNLCNGCESNLDRWHWVTITKINHSDENVISAEVLDNNEIKTVNLSLWQTTTKNYGGFVYFYK